MPFELPALGYAYDALDHTKHHNGYTNKLNAAIEGTDLAGKSIEDILTSLDMTNGAVTPEGRGRLSGPLADAINAAYGSYDGFKEAFAKAAGTRFGSGWAWLCAQEGGKVEICSTANQDNPLMPGIGCGGAPIMGLDVWEHAYYLHYQNRRADYIQAYLSIVNWNKVEANYDAAQ